MSNTAETPARYYKVTDISKMYGIPADIVREMCHARGQRFAFRPGGSRGNFFIDIKRFDEYLERRMTRA